MNKISNILCATLRSALAGAAIEQECYASLSKEEWSELFNLAARQGVLAISYDVISQLPREIQPPRELNIRWAICSERIEERYNTQFKDAAALAELWSNEGIRTLVMKGFSLSQYYPIPSHRECGDFDCYLFGKYEEGNIAAEKAGAKVNREWYKHSQIFFHRTMAENHLYFVTTRKGGSAKSLNDELSKMIGDDLKFLPDSKIEIPSAEFTALFITYHSFTHFVSEGINLRHICDWICFMNAEHKNFDWAKFYAICRHYKFDRFVDVSNAIAVKYLGFTTPSANIVQQSPYTERVMEDILWGDAKIYNKGKGKWHNRFKLISNIYSYSWKYRDIAQSSSARYLWDLVVGFITKRDKH